MKYLLLSIFFSSLIFCTRVNEEDLRKKTTVSPETPPPTIDTSYTYSGFIKPLLKKHSCLSQYCHNSNGVELEPYNKLKSLINNRSFYGALNHEPGFDPMPSSEEKISEDELARVKKWIDKGAQNN